MMMPEGSTLTGGRLTNDADGHPRSQPYDAKLRQLRIRNLLGQSFTVYADLREDITRLTQLFALRECLPKSSHVMTSLRFLFDGMVLEPDVPLLDYGIIPGSVVHTRICPRAWRGETSESSSEDEKEDHGEKDSKKSAWIKMGVTVRTPFGEAKGSLEFPEPYWPMCNLTTKMLTTVYNLTDSIGVNGAFTPGRGIYWQLRLERFQPYACMQPSHASDVWKRLASTSAQMELEAPESWELPRRILARDDESLSFGLLCPDQVDELHLNITLNYEVEQYVHDRTVAFRETEERTEELCCICLEPMVAGEMCRRLPCMHRMHAGCCMMHLPVKPSCPVCRSSLQEKPVPSLPPLPTTPQAVSQGPSPSRRNRGRPPMPSTPALPNLPNGPSAANRENGEIRAVARNQSSNRLQAPDRELPPSPPRGDTPVRSPVPRLLKVLSGGLKTIRSRSWSVPRQGRVLPQEV